MQLKSVRVTNYKSVEDSGQFSVERVTPLVGKNESGKTAILQSLYRLKPVTESEGQFEPLRDYPRKNYSVYKSLHGDSPAIILHTHWMMEEKEIKVFDDLLGPTSYKKEPILVTKDYANIRRVSINVDEAKVISHYVETSGIKASEKSKLLKAANIPTLISAISRLVSPSAEIQQLRDRLKVFGTNTAAQAARTQFVALLPHFVYFPDYESLPGKLSVNQLIRDKSSSSLTFQQMVFIALLQLAGSTPEELRDMNVFDELHSELQAISVRLSQEIFSYWKQNENLEVEFMLDEGLAGDPPPYNQGKVFRIYIKNRRHGVSLSFDERSTGFIWFFSFLVWFSQLKNHYGNNLLLLLDEPGLSLHGKAQFDLLRYIDERLSPEFQVLYTTHSPFMIRSDRLLEARTVEDVITRDGQILGTKVSDDVLVTDPDTLFPLQAALGYDISQLLFVGKNTLLVEGPSDLLYLQLFSQYLAVRGRHGLDVRWTICFTEGIDKMGSFVALFGGRHVSIAILADYHEGDKRKIANLRAMRQVKDRVFTFADFTISEEADIEDVIGRECYIDIINKAYRLPLKVRLLARKSADTPARIIAEVENHFRVLPQTVEEFDHYFPAEWLASLSPDELETLGGFQEAAKRFEKVFDAVNAALELG